MKELFFKVTIAESIEVPLSLAEMRQNPTHSMYVAQYHEKLINVMYTPANGFNEIQFIQLMKRKLKKEFGTANIEYLEIQPKLNDYNNFKANYKSKKK